MALPRLARSTTGNRELDTAINLLAAAVEPYLGKLFLQATALSGVSLAAGTNTINHKLRQAPQGWLVTRLRASAAVTIYEPTTGSDERFLVLVASAACTVDLEVW